MGDLICEKRGGDKKESKKKRGKKERKKEMTKGETLLQNGTGNERTINKSYSNAPVDIL